MFDLIVLGGGPAGYLTAERGAQGGMRVLLIEERALGGVCLNEGCIPTKTLLYSAKIYDKAANGKKYGVTGELTLGHAQVLARKEKTVKTLVAGVKAALKAHGVTVVQARACVSGKKDGGFCVRAGDEEYIGKFLLVATGSRPALPPIPGLNECLAGGQAITSREALLLESPPSSLAVIGGGVIGLELASYYRALGTEVTVIEMLDHIAGENDRELTALLQKQLERRGIVFQLNARVTCMGAEGVTFERNGESAFIPAEKTLVCIGRRPATQDLGLESIQAEVDRGALKTDARMQTNIVNVYAAGDVNGVSMLAHTAYREAEVAVNNMLGRVDSMRYNAIPAVVYTSPELASVGETEESARQKGLDAAVVKLPMRYAGRYLAENEGGDGICKVLIDRKTETLLGMQALADYASEFIIAAGMLVELATPLHRIKEIVFPHPTVGEILREAVFQYSVT